MNRVRGIISELDRDRSVVETIALQNVPASEMEGILNELQGRRADEGYASVFNAVASCAATVA